MTELEAIDELLVYYKAAPQDKVPTPYANAHFRPCPLCRYTGYKEDIYAKIDPAACVKCPWVTFTGFDCVSRGYYSQTAAQRIERLETWRKAITEANNAP